MWSFRRQLTPPLKSLFWGVIRPQVYITLFLVTTATLLFELSLTRLFSVVMYYHFAFLAISLAMFGLGASGLWLYFRRRRHSLENLSRDLTLLTAGFAFTAVIAIVTALSLPITINYSSGNVIRLVVVYLACVLPFFFSGLTVSLILFLGAKAISRLYFMDLIGAATGALLTVPVLNWVGAINGLLIAAALAALAAFLGGEQTRGQLRWLGRAIAAAAIGLVIINSTSPVLKVRYFKGQEKQLVEFQKWNALSCITVQGVEGEQTAKAMDIDADARTYILRDPFRLFGLELIKTEIARRWISHLPNVLRPDGDVLIIGPGGGIDVIFSLAWGARSIDAVEINPIITDDVMRGEYAEFSGRLYSHPAVRVHTAEGRAFIARSNRQYDLIQLTLVDTWAATSAGAFSLSESYLYTVEAFREYLRHLNRDGIVAITRWLSVKPKEGLRLMAVALEAAGTPALQRGENIVIIGSNSRAGGESEMMTMLLKREAFTAAEIAAIENRLNEVGGRFVFRPDGAGDPAFVQLASAADRERFYEGYDFNIRPTTDNQPFFFATAKGTELAQIMAFEYESRKNNLGLFNLYLAGVLSVVLVLTFLVAPIIFSVDGRSALKEPGSLRALGYFIAIGLGFILTEIAVMQKLILYLGHPIYSLTVVLSTILICAGLGSMATTNYVPETGSKRRRVIFSGILAYTLALLVGLGPVTQATFGWPDAARMTLTVLLLAPLGFLMGQPFPLQLKWVEKNHSSFIPWVWSLNGAASVLGSVAAVVLAMTYGFNTVIVIGAVCYLAAFGLGATAAIKRG